MITKNDLFFSSLEWNPIDSSVFVASCEDNSVTIWDLGCERDINQEPNRTTDNEDQNELDKLPPQLLVIGFQKKNLTIA